MIVVKPRDGQFDLSLAGKEKNIARSLEQIVRGTKQKLERAMIESDLSSYNFRSINKERCIRLYFVTLRVNKNVNIFESEAQVKHRSTPSCTGGSTPNSSKIDKRLHIRCLNAKV